MTPRRSQVSIDTEACYARDLSIINPARHLATGRLPADTRHPSHGSVDAAGRTEATMPTRRRDRADTVAAAVERLKPLVRLARF